MHDIVYGNLTWGITICFVLNMFTPFIDGIASYYHLSHHRKLNHETSRGRRRKKKCDMFFYD